MSRKKHNKISISIAEFLLLELKPAKFYQRFVRLVAGKSRRVKKRITKLVRQRRKRLKILLKRRFAVTMRLSKKRFYYLLALLIPTRKDDRKLYLNKIINLGLALLIGFLTLNLAAVTNAFFSDQEIATGNYWQAAVLDTTITLADGFSPVLIPGTTAFSHTTILNGDSVPAELSFDISGLAGGLCDNLTVIARLGDAIVYQGDISNLAAVLGEIGKSQSRELDLEVSLNNDSDIWAGIICSFDLNFKSWQTEITAYGDGGLTDIETAPQTVLTGGWQNISLPASPSWEDVVLGDAVINGIMQLDSIDNNGDDNSEDEWIELPDLTDYDLNPADWDIYSQATGTPEQVDLSTNDQSSGADIESNEPDEEAADSNQESDEGINI